MALTMIRTLTARARPAALIRRTVLIVGVGSFLAVLGPFGTHQLGWPQVWLYWVGLIALGAAFGFGVSALVPRLFPGLPEAAVYALTAALIAVPVTLAVMGLGGSLGAGLTVLELAATYIAVLVVSGFVTGVVYAVTKLAAQPAKPRAAARPARALTDKLPHRLRAAPILALSSEDHYLRVRTAAGEALILMRLSDAAAAMEGFDGARTHRSWWVARAAVADARRGDGRGVLILADGTEAPVSRTYYPALRDAGWF